MILEAFANYLRDCQPDYAATRMLSRWLWERLTQPPETPADKVLHHEILITRQASCSSPSIPGPRRMGVTYTFQGASTTGQKLLNGLYEYALSYEQQKWARWVHKIKASDFTD